MEYVVDFVQMQRFNDPLQVEVLEAMRTPGGKAISEESWQEIVKTRLEHSDAAPDQRLKDARNWYESAYEWRIVSYAMHANARLDAHAAGKILYYIPAVDTPATRLCKEDYDEMRAVANIGHTAKLVSVLPVWVGMEMILTESLLPPKLVRGTKCIVAGSEPHPREPAIEDRDSVRTHGCAVLHFMPKSIYVRIPGCDETFLREGTTGGAQSTDMDLTGMLAIKPQTRSWHFTPAASKTTVTVSRTQIPLLPSKQCTLHGVQGKTADPGFIVHWSYPPALSKESRWLATYVSLSRPRSFKNLLSHGLPDRELIESGPPADIAKAFKTLFETKIAKTKIACKKAREKMNWPPRNQGHKHDLDFAEESQKALKKCKTLKAMPTDVSLGE